jgi:hypothetical protein
MTQPPPPAPIATLRLATAEISRNSVATLRALCCGYKRPSLARCLISPSTRPSFSAHEGGDGSLVGRCSPISAGRGRSCRRRRRGGSRPCPVGGGVLRLPELPPPGETLSADLDAGISLLPNCLYVNSMCATANSMLWCS